MAQAQLAGAPTATAMWLRLSQLGDLLEQLRRIREKELKVSERTTEENANIAESRMFLRKTCSVFPHSTAAAENGSTQAERWSLCFTWRQPKQTFVAPVPCSMTRHKTAKS